MRIGPDILVGHGIGRRCLWGLFALASFTVPSLAQGLPPITGMLPQVAVEAPELEEIVDPVSKEKLKRLSGPFSIRNGSRYDLKDLNIRCDFVAPSGTIIGNQSVTIYEIFRSSGRQSTGALTLPAAPPQARTVNCTATGGAVVAIGAPPPDPCPDCPNLAQLFRTCDCDLAELLESDPQNPQYLIPVRRVHSVTVN